MYDTKLKYNKETQEEEEDCIFFLSYFLNDRKGPVRSIEVN